MSKKTFRIMVLFVALLFCLGIAACHSDSGSSGIIIAGNWNVTLSEAGYPSLYFVFTFYEDGRVYDGQYWGQWEMDSDTITVWGGIYSTTTMTGTVTGYSMSGTWQNSKGSSGTWTATKV